MNFSDPKENPFILSFDVEEFFQVEAAARVVSPDQWDSFSSRLETPVNQILQLLEEHRASATFFILGYVARRQPHLIRAIADAGHEIASHGMTHQMLHRLAPDSFLRELRDSRKLLEDIAGRPVRGFRAPTFSITRNTAWAFDSLLDAGYTYDSSVFPIYHDRYGVPDAPACPHFALGPSRRPILEIPPLTWRILGLNLPVGGGGYIRLLPVRLVHFALQKARKKNLLPMLYIHPWELDPRQPLLPLPWKARFRHRVGLGRTHKKLRWLLHRCAAVSADQILPCLLSSATITFPYAKKAPDKKACMAEEKPI